MGLSPSERQPLGDGAASLRSGRYPISPLHWEVEFPEVFDRGESSGGFDAFVGNPPFAGKNTLINGNREGYLDWLKTIHAESHGNSDLVAHFFRRAFNLLRPGGCFGLIATNTIGQGDTRSTGLRWICKNGGTIFNARKRYRWPGQAAVVVSVVNVCRGAMPGPFLLDGREVPIITAYLFHSGGHEDPSRLAVNEEKSYVGSFVLGLGFTFDDSDSTGDASPLAEMQRLVAKDNRNAERIFPYIVGEEVNSSPSHAPGRQVIDFFDRTLDQASQWPDLIEIVRRKVRPLRDRQKRDANRERWWQYAEKRPGLYRAIHGLDRVLVRSLTSTNFSTFTFLPSGMVYDQTLIVFVFSTFQPFVVLSSRFYEAWAVFFGATMKDDPRYNVDSCFKTFPFPAGFETNAQLDQTGREYHEFRAALMVRHNEGLTKTCNRFHDPHETSPDILQLRALHAAMDRAVLEAYGWHDLVELSVDGSQLSEKKGPRCEFLLDYEDEEDEAPTTDNRQLRTKKKPWRYRWPDDFRDEVLARLLELNKQRAEQEQVAGQSAAGAAKPKRTRKAKAKKPRDDTANLL